MTDEKKIRGEEDHEITQHEINAWIRGKDDAEKNNVLSSLTIAPETAVKVVRLFSELGDKHFISTKLSISVDAVDKVLKTFSVNSIEDARKLMTSGLLSEYSNASFEQRREDEARERQEHAERQRKLDEHEASALRESPSEEAVRAHKEQAEFKNKQDKLRQLIHEGINPSTGTTGFRVPLGRVGEFRSLIVHGVSQLQRRFGGTKQDIINEVKRLEPSIDISMLRP